MRLCTLVCLTAVLAASFAAPKPAPRPFFKKIGRGLSSAFKSTVSFTKNKVVPFAGKVIQNPVVQAGLQAGLGHLQQGLADKMNFMADTIQENGLNGASINIIRNDLQETWQGGVEAAKERMSAAFDCSRLASEEIKKLKLSGILQEAGDESEESSAEALSPAKPAAPVKKPTAPAPKPPAAPVKKPAAPAAPAKKPSYAQMAARPPLRRGKRWIPLAMGAFSMAKNLLKNPVVGDMVKGVGQNLLGNVMGGVQSGGLQGGLSALRQQASPSAIMDSVGAQLGEGQGGALIERLQSLDREEVIDAITSGRFKGPALALLRRSPIVQQLKACVDERVLNPTTAEDEEEEAAMEEAALQQQAMAMAAAQTGQAPATNVNVNIGE